MLMHVAAELTRTIKPAQYGRKLQMDLRVCAQARPLECEESRILNRILTSTDVIVSGRSKKFW